MTLALQAYAKLSFSEVSFPPFWDLGDVRFAPKRPQCLARLTAHSANKAPPPCPCIGRWSGSVRWEGSAPARRPTPTALP
jgi:hypothetical protein